MLNDSLFISMLQFLIRPLKALKIYKIYISFSMVTSIKGSPQIPKNQIYVPESSMTLKTQ